MPTSSVAAERAFAVMRSMDSAQRRRLNENSVYMALMLRVNRPVIKSMLDQRSGDANKTGARSASSAGLSTPSAQRACTEADGEDDDDDY